MAPKGITYAGVGVDYEALDPFKREAQRRAACTSSNLDRFGGTFRVLESSRGESVFLIETPVGIIAHVQEGLGTKNLVVDAMAFDPIGVKGYEHVAQCGVAMIVNDMATMGALPLSVAMHAAAGSSDWFEKPGGGLSKEADALIKGWERACNLSRCVWGPGETPTLKGVVEHGKLELSGSAVGFIRPKRRLIDGSKLSEGDAIVFVESSGVHANGLTLARTVADNLADKYRTKLPDGRSYGETLLDPTHIYVGLVEDCLDMGVDIRYIANVTGHGWRKLMRSPKPFSYVIEELPRQQPIFDFIQEHGPVSESEMYGNFNMGVGFVLYVHESDVPAVTTIADGLGFRAFQAGTVHASEERKVVIEPKGIEFLGSTLGVR